MAEKIKEIKRKAKEGLFKGPLKKRLRNFTPEEMVEMRNKEGDKLIPAIRKINALHLVTQMEGKHQDKVTDHQVKNVVGKLLNERIRPEIIEEAMTKHNHNPERVKKALVDLGWVKVDDKWIKPIKSAKGFE